MPEKISWNLNVQVSGGPKISAAQVIGIEAYDKIEVVIPDGATAEDIEIQPGSASQLRFLLISADQYSDQLTYKVTDGTTTGTAIKLDAQQMLVGAGAIGLLGVDPKKLVFKNATGKDAAVQILAGRNAKTP